MEKLWEELSVQFHRYCTEMRKDLQMLTANINAGSTSASHDNVIDKAWEGGNAADDESNNGTPVGGVLWRVAVDAVEVVHVGYRNISAMNEEVAVRKVSKHEWDTRIIRWTNSVMRMEVIGPRKMV